MSEKKTTVCDGCGKEIDSGNFCKSGWMYVGASVGPAEVKRDACSGACAAGILRKLADEAERL